MSGKPLDSRWTDESEARLRELWSEGCSTAEIGRRMGLTKNSVVGKAHRLGLESKPSPIIRDGRPVKPKPVPRVHGATLTLPPSIIAAQAAEKAAERALVAKLSEIVAAAAEPEPETPRVNFKPLAPRQCCWPLWDGKPTHRYCEAVARPGRAYCSAHHEIAYTKLQKEAGDMAPWVKRDQGLQVVA
jgi:GcrA cell cycle regulator